MEFLYIQDTSKYIDTIWCKILMGQNFDEWASRKIWWKKFDEFHKINAHIY